MRHTRALLLLITFATPARAQLAPAPVPAEVDLATFVETVRRIGAGLEQAEPTRVDAVLAQMPRRMRVRSGDQHFDVPFEPIATAIAGAKLDPSRWPATQRAVRDRLVAIEREALSLVEQPAARAGADPRRALAAILARKEFARAAPDDWPARLRARMREWLLRLWERLGGDRLDPHSIGQVLVWVSTLAAIGGLLFWLYRNARRRITVPTAKTDSPEGETSARGWAQRALGAIGAGAAGDAVRFGYRAAILQLAELGAWRIDDARTAREYVTLIPGNAPRDRAFRDIAAQFEGVVFANRTADAGDLARLVDHLETLGCVRRHERAI